MKALRYILAALIVCALTACAREQMDQLSEPDRFELTATIAPDGPETRTILMDNPGVRMQTSWVAGDAIGIFTSSGDSFTMSVSEGDITNNGRTAVFRSSSAIPSGAISAYYPAISGASISGGKITTAFPNVQHYVKVNGVPQPDPAVSLMAGTGTALSGVAFCNVMAVLKIGQAFDEETVISSVTFRDLDGKAVSGNITIDLADNYASQVSGGSDILTLDCGEDGVRLDEGVMGVFYFIVPAKEYPMGVEIAFNTQEGERMVRTAGTTHGTTFNRGVIYPIGDIANRDYLAGESSSILSDNAYMMTPERLRQMVIIDSGEAPVSNFDGGTVVCDGKAVTAPWFSMLVSNDLGSKEGDYFVFDATDDLTEGGVYQITEMETPFGDESHSRIEIRMTSDFAGAYKRLSFGEQLFDADGNSIEGAGQDLDLSSYLSGIKDSEGNEVPFSISSSGQIVLSNETVEEALTKAVLKMDKSLKTPQLGVKVKSGAVEGSMGLSLAIAIRAGIKIEDGELQWAHVSFNPKVTFAASYSLTGSDYQSKSVHLITLYFIPGIPVAPGVVLTPEIELRAGIGIGGEVKFSTSVSYTYDMGTYGLSYVNGRGFNFIHEEATPPKDDGFNPNVDFSLTGTFYAKGSIIAIPSISLFRVFRAGMYIDFGLKFGLTRGLETIDNNVYDVKKMFLTPDLSFSPYVASLGGVFTKKWDDLIPSPEFDPLWERYLAPVIDKNHALGLIATGVYQEHYRYTDGTSYYFIECQEGYGDNTPIHFLGVAGHGIFNAITGVNYKVKSLKPTLDDWTVVVDVDGGSVSGIPWGNLVLQSQGIISSYSYQYYDRYNMERHEVLTIPNAQKDEEEISAEGTTDVSTIYSGAIRSVHLRCVNKRNNAVIDIRNIGPFSFYWPDTPDGPWFVKRSITEYEYNSTGYGYGSHRIWPSDVPLP